MEGARESPPHRCQAGGFLRAPGRERGCPLSAAAHSSAAHPLPPGPERTQLLTRAGTDSWASVFSQSTGRSGGACMSPGLREGWGSPLHLWKGPWAPWKTPALASGMGGLHVLARWVPGIGRHVCVSPQQVSLAGTRVSFGRRGTSAFGWEARTHPGFGEPGHLVCPVGKRGPPGNRGATVAGHLHLETVRAATSEGTGGAGQRHVPQHDRASRLESAEVPNHRAPRPCLPPLEK